MVFHTGCRTSTKSRLAFSSLGHSNERALEEKKHKFRCAYSGGSLSSQCQRCLARRPQTTAVDADRLQEARVLPLPMFPAVLLEVCTFLSHPLAVMRRDFAHVCPALFSIMPFYCYRSPLFVYVTVAAKCDAPLISFHAWCAAFLVSCFYFLAVFSRLYFLTVCCCHVFNLVRIH